MLTISKTHCAALVACCAIVAAGTRADGREPWRLPPVEGVEIAQLAPMDLQPVVDDLPIGSGLSEQEMAEVETTVLGDVTLEDVEQEAMWYDWLVPSYWHMPVNWESSFELGIDGSEGNASTLSFRSGVDVRRKVGASDLKVSINYVKSTAEQVETKHNAQLKANHDWLLGKSPWSLFAKTILVYDEFRPFDLELTVNSGLGYMFIDNDIWSFKGRFGSGASRQWDGPKDSWRPEAMLGVDFNYALSNRQKLSITSEYYPDWTDFEIYRIRTDAGWEMLIDEATNMSLKLGVIDRYDSNAGGTRPNTLDYSLLLLWKL